MRFAWPERSEALHSLPASVGSGAAGRPGPVRVGFALQEGYTSKIKIYIRGDLTMIFDPPPTILEGKLNGKVSIVGLSFNFKAEMRKEI